MIGRCWGGPLDGQVHDFDWVCFPYPRGWYYRNLTLGEDTTTVVGEVRWVWRDQPGTFTDRDLEWCREHGLLGAPE